MFEIKTLVRQAAKMNQKLTTDEEISYFKIIHAENTAENIKNLAINRIIQNHILFVIACAKKFVNKSFDLTDLIQEGILGMKTAILKYDINANVKFLSYAVWYIVQRIKHYVDTQSSVIYIPTNKKQEINKINNLLKTNNINDLNLSKEKYEEYVNISNILNMNSLNQPITGMTDEIQLMDLLSDNTFVNDLKQNDLKTVIDNITKDSSIKDKSIIYRIYGINCDPSKLEDLSFEMGICHQRLSSIKKNILKKLRKKVGTTKLHDFLPNMD